MHFRVSERLIIYRNWDILRVCGYGLLGNPIGVEFSNDFHIMFKRFFFNSKSKEVRKIFDPSEVRISENMLLNIVLNSAFKKN